MLVSCGRNYKNAKNTHEDYANGYFTVIKKWNNSTCLIVYANDTGVMYYIYDGDRQYGITPLFNADGTLQVYKKD